MNAQSGDERFFTDDEVEALFGVTSSKLRTAQRYGLIESVQTLHHGRYIRAWDEGAAMRAYSSNVFAENMTVPFHVACQINAAYIDFFFKVEEMVEKFTRRDAFISYKTDVNVPLVALVDRTVVLILHKGADVPIGRIERGEDGRMEFVNDADQAVPCKSETLCLTIYDPRVVIDRFIKITSA